MVWFFFFKLEVVFSLYSGVVAGHSQAKCTQIELLVPPLGFLLAVLPPLVFRFCAACLSGHPPFKTCLLPEVPQFADWIMEMRSQLMLYFVSSSHIELTGLKMKFCFILTAKLNPPKPTSLADTKFKRHPSFAVGETTYLFKSYRYV